LHPREKDALLSAIYEWIDTGGYESVPEAVRTGLRYGLYSDLEDDLAGTFLFELHRGSAMQQVPVYRESTPAIGQSVEIHGESWIVEALAPYPIGGEYLATVRVRWHPG
jgi:hypothetical protein